MSENTKVIRIRLDTYKKIKKLQHDESLVNFITNAVETVEMLTKHEPIYVVGNINYTDIREARGQAILESAKAGKAELSLPYIAVILGQDNGI